MKAKRGEQFNVRMTSQLRRKIETEAEAWGMGLSDFTEMAMENYLERSPVLRAVSTLRSVLQPKARA